jgi:hypothetical protein
VATPDSHSTFVGWSGCSSEPTLGKCVVSSIAANTTLTATANLGGRSLTVNKVGSGSGSVTCNGSSCASSYVDGTKVTLAAIPASDSTFVGWSGGGCSGTGNCVITLGADTSVTATFNRNQPSASCASDPFFCAPPSDELEPSNRAKPGAVKQQGQDLALKVTVPGAGVVTASGDNLVKAHGTAKGTGTLTLTLKLTSAGRKQLQKRGKLKVQVKIVFTPYGGTPGMTTKTVTFRAKSK